MDRHRRHAGPGELAGSTVGAMTSSGEHDRATEGGDDRCAERNAFRAGKLPEVVGHLVEIGGGFTDLVTHGIGLVRLREFGDLAVERRRIQHGLWVVAGLIEQPLHRRHESHVGHAVGLVDDDVFDLGERHDPLLNQILESAGRCDEHVDAVGESVDLGLKADAAVDGESVTPDSGEHRRKFVMDLAGEFAGRRQDQDPGAFLAGRAAFERQRNCRNAERQRLSRSGRGPTDDVASVDQIGDGLGLDGERLRDAGGAQRLDDGRRDTELGERRRAGHPLTVLAAPVGFADTHRGGGRRVRPRRCLGRYAWLHGSCSNAHRSEPRAVRTGRTSDGSPPSTSVAGSHSPLEALERCDAFSHRVRGVSPHVFATMDLTPPPQLESYGMYIHFGAFRLAPHLEHSRMSRPSSVSPASPKR